MATDYGLSHPLKFISNDIGWSDQSQLVNQPTKTRNSMGVSFLILITKMQIPFFFLISIELEKKLMATYSGILIKK